MKLRFLGTGTSFGIPVIGCRCDVCSSTDPRNQRTRHGVVLEAGDRKLLVDTPPELRLQLLAADIDRVDAVFLTHPHADHLHGIDDLRAFTGHGESRLPLHLAAEHVAGFDLRVIGFPHGAYRSYGFRCGDLSLIVDAKQVPDDAWGLLEGTRVLVLNALWYGSPHPAHFNVEQALEVIERVAPERALLTHLTHRLDHAELNEKLPRGVEAAYDGLTVQI